MFYMNSRTFLLTWIDKFTHSLHKGKYKSSWLAEPNLIMQIEWILDDNDSKYAVSTLWKWEDATRVWQSAALWKKKRSCRFQLLCVALKHLVVLAVA